MSDDFSHTVISTAVMHYPSASPSVRRQFEKMLRDQSGLLKIPGFHDASKTLSGSSFLLPQYLQRKAHNGSVLEALLALWEDAKPALRKAIRAFLANNGISLRDGVLSNQLTGEWTLDAANKAAEDFMSLHAEYEYNETTLMLFCQAAMVPLPAEAVANVLEPTSTLMDKPDKCCTIRYVPTNLPLRGSCCQRT